MINILLMIATIFSTHLNIQASTCVNTLKASNEVCQMDCCNGKQKPCCDFETCNTSVNINYIVSDVIHVDDTRIKLERNKIIFEKTEHRYAIYAQHFRPPRNTAIILL